MTPIALGLVGFGKIARDQHLPALAESPDFRLVAVADPAACHASLPSYPDLGAMLSAHPEIAAVSLCTPPRVRAEAARHAIAAGRHLLLEKPPCASLAEARELARVADAADVTLFTAWHSQQAAGVAAARDWLAHRTIRAVRVAWKEDVRVWHPGQQWIWDAGGFGVFDPGINALSILTAILPGALRVTEADLSIPANQATPIAAALSLESDAGFAIHAEFDFRQTGPQSWDIDAETDGGTLRLAYGGNRLAIDEQDVDVGPEAEYRALYRRYAALIRARESEAHLDPLRLVEQAMQCGRATRVEPFLELA